MTDLICRKSMNRCQTPGMCSPHGGCQTPETASAFRALLAERNSLAYLLKRFVGGEHDQGENQSERHMYHDEAEALLAYLGGEIQGHTLVPDEILRKQYEQRTALIAENETLVATAQSFRDEWRKDQADAARYRWIEPVFAGLFGIASLDAHIDAAMIDESVETPSTDTEDVSRHEGGQT